MAAERMLPRILPPKKSPNIGNPYLIYNSICLHVHRAVLGKLERPTEINKRFLPYNTTPNILDDGLLGRLFDSLSALSDAPSALLSVTQGEKVKRVRKRDLYDLLAVLLYSSCDITAVVAFQEKLVLVCDEKWDEICSDRQRHNASPLGKLPLETPDAERIFDAEKIDVLDNIASNQSIFCPVQLLKYDELVLEASQPHRFPYIQEVAIGEGYSGKVSRVIIAKGYFYNKKDDSINRAEIELARKDYNTEENHRIRKLHMGSGRRIREEKEIIQILNKFRGNPNIVKSLGAYESGPVYSLFLELAADDLKAYLSSRDERLASSEAKAEFLQCAVGLASGLTFLHEGIQLPDYETAVCYHLDLKPDNVLVFRSVNREGHETTTWKIGDFGVAVLKTRREQQGDIRNRPRKWFSLQKGYSEFSGTQNPRLQGTYLAPESEISLPDMGAHSDVWSLGCIMSMLLTYLESGWPGVRQYSDERCNERKIKQSDQFFRPPLGWADFKLNPKVLEQHQHLIHQAEARELRAEKALPGEGRAVDNFLSFLEKSVLVTSWRQRKATAKDIKIELTRLAEFYQSPTLSDTNATTDVVISALKNLQLWSRVRLLCHDTTVDGSNEERPWFLIPRHTNIKASIIALDGTTIAFWSNEYIRLYTPEMLNGERPPKGELKAYGISDKLGQNICYWESVDLNQECLVASTNRINFDCYVFETQDDDINGPTLQKKYRLFLQLPRIRRVAISPDNHWFVCVVNHEQSSELPGTLLVAEMKYVLEAAKMRSNITEENFARRIPDRASIIPWEASIRLTSAAANLTYLTISKDNIVFIASTVSQSSPNDENNQNSIMLHSFDVLKHKFHTIRLESPPLEYSTVSFFTTFTPFRKQDACAIVTHEHRFHIQYFTEDPDPRDVVQSVTRYRLLDIIMDLDDETVFALGTESANSNVWLLRFSVPKSNKDDIVINKVQKMDKILYDDDCALSMSLEGDARYMVVSVARGIMYRLNLSQQSN